MANTYTTTLGDSWDLIAWRVYGDAMLAPALMQANLEHLETYVFDAGVVLAVPTLTVADVGSVNMPPWRKR